jgi:hypothetical protein
MVEAIPGRYGDLPFEWALGRVGRAAVHMWSGDVEGANTLLRSASGALAPEASAFIRLAYRDVQAEVRMLAGDAQGALAAYQQAEAELGRWKRIVQQAREELGRKKETRAGLEAVLEKDDLHGLHEKLAQAQESVRRHEEEVLRLEDAIRKMVRDQSQAKAGSGLMSGPPPADLKIESKHTAKYLRTALNFWVKELRPKAQSWRPEVGSGLDAKSADKGEECVLLAELRVPLKRASSTARVFQAASSE